MIPFIRSWAEQIIVAVIIVTILEKILPEGNNKKYIKMMMGVYILFVMISPIIGKVSGKDFSLAEYQNYLGGSTEQVSSEEIERVREKTIEQQYQEKIKQDMKTRLQEMGYQVNSIIIETNFQKEYGKIDKVNLNMTEKKKSSEENVSQVNKVEEITVEINKKQKEKQNVLEKKDKEEIQKLLKETYDIDKEKIYFE